MCPRTEPSFRVPQTRRWPLTFCEWCISLNRPCFLFCLSAQDEFRISCPATGFTVGVAASVTCSVKKAAFITPCKLDATFIKFYFTPSGGGTTEWCSSPYTTCPNTGTPVTCNTCGCECVTDDGTFLTHRLNFTPTAAQDGGKLTCEVVCFNSGTLPLLTSDHCDPISVCKLIMRPTFLTPRHALQVLTVWLAAFLCPS